MVFVSSQVSTDSGERNSGQNPSAIRILKGTQGTTVCNRCQPVDSSANFGCTCGRIYNRNFHNVDRAMCPWKHIEMLVTWKCQKMAANGILKTAVQLTAVAIKLTAARTEILFTNPVQQVFICIQVDDIFSIFRVYPQKSTFQLLPTHATQSTEFIFRI